jgi:nucleoid DNA-binding protein
MDWYSMNGKSGLIRDLAAQGFSVRKSTKAVNAVFDCMRRGLARGETVEVPGGRLRVQIWNARRKHFLKFQKLKNVNTGKLFYRIVRYPGWRRVIRFDPDLNLNLDHCAEYPPPTRSVAACPWLFQNQDPAQVEAWKLAAGLLGHPVDTATMTVLQQGADRNPYYRGALLPMLRQCSRIGLRPPSVPALAEALAQAGAW